MGEFKKSGGFGRGGNPRTKRAEQSRMTAKKSAKAKK